MKKLARRLNEICYEILRSLELHISNCFINEGKMSENEKNFISSAVSAHLLLDYFCSGRILLTEFLKYITVKFYPRF